MKKQPEVTALTREKLIEAFWSLYCQKKIEHISIKEITDKAGYHRSTFYEYFVDIYDLLNQLEESLITHIKGNVLEGLTDILDENIFQGLVNVYESKGKYLSVLLGENGDPTFSNKLKAVMRPALMESFGLPDSEMHTGYIMEFGLSAILSTITHWYQSKRDLPLKEVVFLVRSMLMNGVYPMVMKYSKTSTDPH